MTEEEFKEGFERTKATFEKCSPLFIALGDPIRQRLLLQIAVKGLEGINVSELTETSTLSRPAISHHLKILKDAGLVHAEKRQTKIFYHVEPERGIETLQTMISEVTGFCAAVRKDSEANANHAGRA